MTPVLSLTSYDGTYPASAAAYVSSLQALLGLGVAIGYPIRYVEAWNEPNDQGRMPASRAATLADAAQAVCAGGGTAR